MTGGQYQLKVQWYRSDGVPFDAPKMVLGVDSRGRLIQGKESTSTCKDDWFLMEEAILLSLKVSGSGTYAKATITTVDGEQFSYRLRQPA